MVVVVEEEEATTAVYDAVVEQYRYLLIVYVCMPMAVVRGKRLPQISAVVNRTYTAARIDRDQHTTIRHEKSSCTGNTSIRRHNRPKNDTTTTTQQQEPIGQRNSRPRTKEEQ